MARWHGRAGGPVSRFRHRRGHLARQRATAAAGGRDAAARGRESGAPETVRRQDLLYRPSRGGRVLAAQQPPRAPAVDGRDQRNHVGNPNRSRVVLREDRWDVQVRLVLAGHDATEDPCQQVLPRGSVARQLPHVHVRRAALGVLQSAPADFALVLESVKQGITFVCVYVILDGL